MSKVPKTTVRFRGIGDRSYSRDLSTKPDRWRLLAIRGRPDFVVPIDIEGFFGVPGTLAKQHNRVAGSHKNNEIFCMQQK
jgi:hypothetical protein